MIVSVPKRFPANEVASLIERNRDWIRSSLEELENNTPECFRHWPPEALQLKALGLSVQLHYHSSSSLPTDTALELHRRILSPVDDKAAVAKEIAQHLKVLARSYLPSWLAAQAHLHGLHYQRVSIRGQRTVWGSYSSSGTLSLNYKLLFLRRELVDYVLLHELAHTVHLNHSQAFWQLLSALDVNARKLDGQLGAARLQVPPWLELAT